MLDCVTLEMRMAALMAQQEASGFRFDMDAAERVRSELTDEMTHLQNTIKSRYIYTPGKVFTPKRKDKKNGYEAGCPMTKLVEFNPTSRQQIAWALQTFRGARFTKVTATGSRVLFSAHTLIERKGQCTENKNNGNRNDNFYQGKPCISSPHIPRTAVHPSIGAITISPGHWNNLIGYLGHRFKT